MVIRGASIFALVVLLAGAAVGQITFGTSGNYIQVSTNRLNYGTNYTVTAWVNPNKALMNANTYGGIIITDRSGNTSSGDRNFQMAYGKTAGLFFTVHRGPGFSSAIYPVYLVADGKWTHLVGVCDGNNGEVRLYVDGTLAVSTNLIGAPDTNSVVTRIGNLAWDAAPVDHYQWEGSIQDVRIYSRVLTASEIGTMALYPWSLADDPKMILRTAIDQKPTGVALTSAAENHGSQLITPMNYVSGVTAAVTRVQIVKPLQMELP